MVYSKTKYSLFNKEKNPDKNIGIHYNKNEKRWKANICIHGKHIYLGSFRKEEDALKSYLKKFKNLDGIKPIVKLPNWIKDDA